MFWELFWVYFQIGLFSFGGGYAAMPFIQSLVVEGKHWLTMGEYADLVTIAEMTPGPIAVNSATFVGQKMAGFWGAAVCTLGCIAPSLILVLALSWLYQKYKTLPVIQTTLKTVRPAVAAIVASAGVSLLVSALFGADTSFWSLPDLRWIELGLFAVSLYLLRTKKAGPVQIIFGTALAGSVLYFFLSV